MKPKRDPDFHAFLDIMRRDFSGANVTYYNNGKGKVFGKPTPHGVPVSEPWIVKK